MGMLRTTIILGAILFALPAPPDDPAEKLAAEPDPGTFGYVAAAAQAFSDVKDFCGRRPFVCQTAGHLASAVERKAKYSAKLIYEWANDATAPATAQLPHSRDLATVEKLETASLAQLIASTAPMELDMFLLPQDEPLALPAGRHG
jgi:hypothetical protein